MATNAELEAQLLAALAKKPDLKFAQALLLDPPHRSDTALPCLRLALGVVAASGTRADLAWLKKLAAKSKRSWPATWMRDWFLQSIASTGELLGRFLSGEAKPLRSPLPTKPHLRWLVLAGHQDFSQLDALLGDLVDGPATQIAQRAQALLGWPKEPRIAHAALAAHQGRLVNNPRHPIWDALGNLIAVHADAALRKKIAGLLAEDPTLAWAHGVSHWRGGADPLPRVAATAETAGAPTTPDAWARWVLAAPEDLSRRALWADWLLERDDPRGELVSLQLADRALTAAEQKRIDALIRKHGRSWIGKLGGVADPKRLKFERGVLIGVRLFAVADGRIAVDDPHWNAIEELELPSYGVSKKLEQRVVDCFPRLRSLEGVLVTLELLTRLAEVGAPKLERLGVELRFGTAKVGRGEFEFLATAKLPALRTFLVGGKPRPELVPTQR